MAEFESLLPRVLQRAISLPEPVALDAIRDAVIEMCERTRCWNEDQTVTLAAAGDSVLIVPPGAELISIDSVVYGGEPLSPINTKELDARIYNWRNTTEGCPRFYTQLEWNTLRMVPSDVGQVFQVRTFLKPSESATEAPDKFMNQRRELIADLALGRALLIPNQSWSNPNLGAYHAEKGQIKLDELFAQFRKGQQRAAIRTTPRFF